MIIFSLTFNNFYSSLGVMVHCRLLIDYLCLTSVNNVKNYVESDKFKNSAGNIGRTIGDVLGGIFKAIFGFLGAVLGFAGVILLGVLVLALMFLIFEPGILNGFTPEIVTSTDVLSSEKAVLFIISLLLVVGCPIFMIIH